MKATNKVSDFNVSNIFENIKLPNFCMEKPSGFEEYKWVTRDNRIVPIHEFHDNHLLNTYRMLMRTVQYAREISEHTMITRVVEQVIRQCRYHVHFIGYEIYLRKNLKIEDKHDRAITSG